MDGFGNHYMESSVWRCYGSEGLVSQRKGIAVVSNNLLLDVEMLSWAQLL